MPNNSVFDELSQAELDKIDAEIAARRFKGYTGLAAWCEEHGWEVSRSALWNRGSKIKKEQQRVKNATTAAIAINEAAKDDGGDLNDATLRVVQSRIFEVLINLAEANEEDDPEKLVNLLSKAAKAVSDIGRASIPVKKYKAEVRARAQSVAEKVEETGKKGGLSAETIDLLKRQILGIAE